MCRKVGISVAQVAAVIVGLPCGSYNHANAPNISRGNNYRDHSLADKPPRSKLSCKTQADRGKKNKAIRDDNMCKNILASYFRGKSAGHEYQLIVGDPVGALRKRPFMRGEQFEAVIQRNPVDYCAYHKKYREQTYIWNVNKEALLEMDDATTGNVAWDLKTRKENLNTTVQLEDQMKSG